MGVGLKNKKGAGGRRGRGLAREGWRLEDAEDGCGMGDGEEPRKLRQVPGRGQPAVRVLPGTSPSPQAWVLGHCHLHPGRGRGCTLRGRGRVKSSGPRPGTRGTSTRGEGRRRPRARAGPGAGRAGRGRARTD